jgi:3-oxoacyl-[acyl-carrier protein] reductase
MTAPRTALVTGGAGGIGAAIAERLASTGHRVLVTDLNPERAEQVAEAIRHRGGHAWARHLDVTDAASRRSVIDFAVNELGGLDVLVNCAGVLKDARIRTLEPDRFADLQHINLIGPLALTRLAIEPMTAAGGGAVINIASRAWLGTFGSAAYSASKGGLVGATRSLALELGHSGITVNCVAPGFIDTEMTAAMPDKILHRIRAAIPVGRGGTPTDVAEAVSYLATAGYTTGQVLVVCGGRSIGVPLSSVAMTNTPSP